MGRNKNPIKTAAVLLSICALILTGRQAERVAGQRQDLVLPDQPVNRDPVAAIPYQETGTIHAAQDSLLQAIKDYDEAIRLDHRYVQAYYSRGFVFNRLERPLRAIEDFNQAILLDPGVAEAYLGRGESHAALNQIPQALEHYGEAIRQDPGYARAYYIRGNAYASLGQAHRAIDDWENATQADNQLAPAFPFGRSLPRGGPSPSRTGKPEPRPPSKIGGCRDSC